MSFIKKVEFGNYTLNFGKDKVLLDLFENIVMPSFHEMKYIRKLKDKSDYFFLDTQLVNLDESGEKTELAIIGRIIKNTILKRDQIFRQEGGLIPNKKELETAPSSIFVLLLENHRLLFCREVSGAPTIQNFQSTSLYCLKNQHENFITEKYENSKKSREEYPSLDRITKKSLLIDYPFPILRITPLSDSQSLNDFVNRFKQIDEVIIKLLKTNKEDIDNDDFWAELGKRKNEMNSGNTSVRFSNAKDGLDAKCVKEQTTSAGNLGNSEINIKGHDSEGGSIKGNNDDFSLSIELISLSSNIKLAANELYKNFKRLITNGTIITPTITQGTIDKVKSISNRI